MCQIQSSSTGAYPDCRRVRRMTMHTYTTPTSPQAPIAIAALDNVGHGAATIDASSRTNAKWRIVGVPKASIVSLELGRLVSATSAITTNCSPVSAAAEDPTIT